MTTVLFHVRIFWKLLCECGTPSQVSDSLDHGIVLCSTIYADIYRMFYTDLILKSTCSSKVIGIEMVSSEERVV